VPRAIFTPPLVYPLSFRARYFPAPLLPIAGLELLELAQTRCPLKPHGMAHGMPGQAGRAKPGLRGAPPLTLRAGKAERRQGVYVQSEKAEKLMEVVDSTFMRPTDYSSLK
jgi:hypothetical protein